MRALLVSLIVSVLTGCGGPSCDTGTLVVALTPDAAANKADTLRVRATVDGKTESVVVPYTGQTQVGVVFPSTAYAKGIVVDVLVEARAGDAVVASASSGGYVLPATCAVLPLTLTDAGTTFSVSGIAQGLFGMGLVLEDTTESLAIAMNGAFSFPTAIASGLPYAVTVATSPSAPSQACSIANGEGTIDDANITNVTVSCATNSFTIGGAVNGLAGTGLVLELDGLQDVTVASAGLSYMFANPVLSGTIYTVKVLTPPSSPAQTCHFSNLTDTTTSTVGGANITNLDLTCTTP